MKIKINETLSTLYTAPATNTKTDELPKGESFEDVLVLNQNALKAMTIDAMIAKSTTRSVNPIAVNHEAIMEFRSTLASRFIAPIPDANLIQVPPTTPGISTPILSTSPSTDEVSSDGAIEKNESTNGIFNTGTLECSEELNSYFAEASQTYGVDAKLLKSIACTESNFNSDCTSKAGAMGIMQLMPSTAEYLGVENAYDARQNILGGAKYFAKMLNRYEGDVSLALAAYNAGPGNVDKYGGIPPFAETQNYVPKVLNYYNSI